MVTVMGNLGLITLIGLNSYLHTLIYFFLFSLSLIDICYSSIFTPNLLINFFFYLLFFILFFFICSEFCHTLK